MYEFEINEKTRFVHAGQLTYHSSRPANLSVSDGQISKYQDPGEGAVGLFISPSYFMSECGVAAFFRVDSLFACGIFPDPSTILLGPKTKVSLC